MVPSPYELVWLALATWRIWLLLAEDDILNDQRDWAVAHTPHWFEEWLACPWCSGFWIGGILWTGWWFWGDWTLTALTPFVVSAVVGALAHFVRPGP